MQRLACSFVFRKYSSYTRLNKSLNGLSVTPTAPGRAAFQTQYFISLSNPISWEVYKLLHLLGNGNIFTRTLKCDLNSYKSMGNFGEKTELEEGLEKFHDAQFISVAFPFPNSLISSFQVFRRGGGSEEGCKRPRFILHAVLPQLCPAGSTGQVLR